jgi:hypothetical protein
MSLLAELGFDSEGPMMLIEPPDDVLLAAQAMKPRPSIASTLQVAEPSPRMVWWAEPGSLRAATLSRFRWMISAAGPADAWLVVAPGEAGAGALRQKLAGSSLNVVEQRALSDGALAMKVKPAPQA